MEKQNDNALRLLETKQGEILIFLNKMCFKKSPLFTVFLEKQFLLQEEKRHQHRLIKGEGSAEFGFSLFFLLLRTKTVFCLIADCVP